MFDVLKTVLYGAIGVRRKEDHESARIRPVHLIIVAVLFVAAFILVLRTIVHLVTS
jgi:Protein of unknown function (DUF2970)